MPPTGYLSTPVSIANGGTSSSSNSLDGSSIMVSNGAAVIQGSKGTSTQVLHGNAAGLPTYSSVSLSNDITGTLSTANGGTGQTIFTDGQLLIGKTDGTLAKTTLTAGSGVSITNGNGVVTIATSGGSVPDAWAFWHQYPPGSHAGTLSSGTWNVRTLNNYSGSGSAVSLSSNQITMAPGTYDVYVSAPAYKVDGHVIRFFNVTLGIAETLGGTAYSSSADSVMTFSIINFRLTIASTYVFRVEHYCKTTRSTDGAGIAANLTGIANEIYTQVRITKLA